MIKKYLLSTLIGGSLLLGASSCGEDFLDRNPLDTRMEDNFYQTESDAMEALGSVYDVLQWQTTSGIYEPLELVLDIASGDSKKGGSGPNDMAQLQDFVDGTIDPNNSVVFGWWKKYYFGIYRANVYLDKIEGITAEPEFKKRTIAEARFLRAFYYFDLVRLFGNVPLILTPLEPEEYNQPQASAQEVYNQIATDLLVAINDLPKDISAEETGRINKSAAKALLAKVYLHHNADMTATGGETVNKTKALALLEEVIASGTFSLLPNFADIWKLENENSSESVFEIQFSDLASWSDWGYLIGTEGNMAVTMQGIRGYSGDVYYSGWSFNIPKAEFIASFDDADSRKAATFINVEDELEPDTYSMDFPDYNGFYGRKYLADKIHEGAGGELAHNFSNNLRTIRYADVLLMAAELGSNVDYLNQVRERAGLPALGAYSLEALKEERRLEFAMEGIRYLDLVRWGDNNLGNKLFPIPQSEIDLSGGVFVQN